MVGLTIGLLLAVVLLEVPGMLKRRMWRDLLVFAFYLTIGAALTIPQALGIRLPNPTKVINALFEPLWRLIK